MHPALHRQFIDLRSDSFAIRQRAVMVLGFFLEWSRDPSATPDEEIEGPLRSLVLDYDAYAELIDALCTAALEGASDTRGGLISIMGVGRPAVCCHFLIELANNNHCQIGDSEQLALLRSLSRTLEYEGNPTEAPFTRLDLLRLGDPRSAVAEMAERGSEDVRHAATGVHQRITRLLDDDEVVARRDE